MAEDWNEGEIRQSVKEHIGELVTAELMSHAAGDDGAHSDAEVAADRIAADLELTDRQRILVRTMQLVIGRLVEVVEPDEPLDYWRAFVLAMHED